MTLTEVGAQFAPSSLLYSQYHGDRTSITPFLHLKTPNQDLYHDFTTINVDILSSTVLDDYQACPKYRRLPAPQARPAKNPVLDFRAFVSPAHKHTSFDRSLLSNASLHPEERTIG